MDILKNVIDRSMINSRVLIVAVRPCFLVMVLDPTLNSVRERHTGCFRSRDYWVCTLISTTRIFAKR